MLIIGCGNQQRGDDAVGILVAERLRKLGIRVDICNGGSAELIEAWTGANDVIVVDAVVTGAPVGTVRTWNVRETPISLEAPASTHGLGVAEAIELARILDRLPTRLQIYAIEGQRFAAGGEISPELNVAIDEVVRKIIEDLGGNKECSSPPAFLGPGPGTRD
jgi:hydrogenase maturation protease